MKMGESALFAKALCVLSFVLGRHGGDCDIFPAGVRDH